MTGIDRGPPGRPSPLLLFFSPCPPRALSLLCCALVAWRRGQCAAAAVMEGKQKLKGGEMGAHKMGYMYDVYWYFVILDGQDVCFMTLLIWECRRTSGQWNGVVVRMLSRDGAS